MTVEMTPHEAEILISVLLFAEGAAWEQAPALSEAIQVLRPWRSALLATYLRERFAQPEAVGAVDPQAASTGTPSTREKASDV
jgi:hypothetical protein